MAKLFLLISVAASLATQAQPRSALGEKQWVDSVFSSLTEDQRLAQLMIVRLSGQDPVTKKTIYLDSAVQAAIRQYNVGGLCLFQGGPLTLAGYLNYYQSLARTPLLLSIDAENGLGMRLDSVQGLPRQMMLGAMQDGSVVYRYGQLVAAQCRRLGLQVNYAPVVDINNNPDNPVINDRSFGQDKYKVGDFGLRYMRGLQDGGIMACAKHFPGHGDVAVDSHKDLPLISKTRAQLDSLELYPFRLLVREGVSSVMVAHLSIPAIDNSPNRPSSLSGRTVNGLLKKELGFKGLSYTDALEMKGVSKYFPEGEASAESLIAGNDLLCLPGDIPGSLEKIHAALKSRRLKWKDLNARVKKVLQAKYRYGLANPVPVETANLTGDLNNGIGEMKKLVAQKAITLLKNDQPGLFPLLMNDKKRRVAYIGLGLTGDNAFGRHLREDYNAQAYYFDYHMDSSQARALLDFIRNRYDVVIAGVHNYNRYPAGNFGVSAPALYLLQQLQQEFRTLTVVFGNPYLIKNFPDARTLLACYEDDETVENTAADLINGIFQPQGKLPVTVSSSLPFGSGITGSGLLPAANPADAGLDEVRLNKIDSIARDGIRRHAYPGCVVLVAREGKVVLERAYGHMTYESRQPMYPETIFDMASVTKVMATTLSLMKLYDEGKLDLHKTLGDYLPWTRGTDKASLVIWDVLLHQAGLKAFIPFFKETIDLQHQDAPLGKYYAFQPDSLHQVRVAANLFMRNDWVDTLYQRILQSPLTARGNYIYSDNDFIFLGKVVEALGGMPLDQYAKTNFYDPLGLTSTGFKPRERFPLDHIAPTEEETGFRRQLLWGDVHDPGAAMFGGVAGHAGLFSSAGDLAVLCQLLLNGGSFGGRSYIKKETIDYFAAYHSDNSRRGLGFDKPEKDNASRKEPYPCLSASPQTIGHTGYTGTCIWVDPVKQLTFVFLSNRVNPSGGTNTKLSDLNIRPKIMQAIYDAMTR